MGFSSRLGCIHNFNPSQFAIEIVFHEGRHQYVGTTLKNNPLPKRTWQVLGLAAVLLLALTVGAIGFISAGFFDPKPVGEITAELALKPQYVPGQTENIQWQNEPLPADDFSLRLTAAYQSGDLDSGYGLALGADESVLIVALSPLGYVTIHQLERPSTIVEDSADLNNMIANGPSFSPPKNEGLMADTTILDWQPWPHVNQGTETNEIWLDKRGDTITIYINREHLWTGPISPPPSSQIGLFTASFNKTTTIDFKTLEIFTENN